MSERPAPMPDDGYRSGSIDTTHISRTAEELKERDDFTRELAGKALDAYRERFPDDGATSADLSISKNQKKELTHERFPPKVKP